ncbi:MAG TPA: ribonuclease HII [Thermomicrobiales bacterium]
MGYRLIAGVDEVGRGAMAGPLVAAAVVLPPDIAEFGETPSALAGVRDSKLLSEVARCRLLPTICATALAVAVGVVEAGELDEIGAGPANRLAMERAVQALPIVPEALVLDAATIDLDVPQVGLIDGDARCLSIAAASIVAKVTRDRFMTECHGIDPRFGFAAHKGYCTEDHLAALARFGPCDLHRRSFAPVGRVCNGLKP